MKIAIFGSYNGTSVGDTAILLGLLRAIRTVLPDAEVTVLSMGPVDLARDLDLVGRMPSPPRLFRANAWALQEMPVLRSLVWRLGVNPGRWLGPLNARRCRAILAAQDLLIIGGGNLLMDLFDGNVRILETMCGAADSTGTPYAVVGVGAGPVVREDSRERLAACVAGARCVSLRDQASRTLCSEVLGRKDARRMPDPAFALEPVAPRLQRNSLALNVAALGSSAWPWQDEHRYGAYIGAFTRMAQVAARRFKPDRVEIVSTNDAVDRQATQEVAAALAVGPSAVACPVSVVACADVTEALDAFSRAETAITTRLHAGILASISGCKVLPVAYDGKVREVLEGEGIAIDAPDPQTIAEPGWSPEPLFDRMERETTSLRAGVAEEVVAAVCDAIRGAS